MKPEIREIRRDFAGRAVFAELPAFIMAGVEMKQRPIIIDDHKRELTQHGTRAFPLSMDRQNVRDPGLGGVEHWHREIQLMLVTRGIVQVRANGISRKLEVGQGAFINSGVLHEADPVGKSEGEYVALDFAPEILCGPTGDATGEEYVEPLVRSPELSAIILTDKPWHREICDAVRRIGEIYDEMGYAYELEIKSILFTLWKRILENEREYIVKSSGVSFSDRRRVKEMKAFIEKNYNRKLELAEIAGVTHISRGECCRVFRRVENVTPVEYLTKVRIDKSLPLLEATSISISEIGERVGFGSTSHYIERFRRETGVTPRAYRMMHRVNVIDHTSGNRGNNGDAGFAGGGDSGTAGNTAAGGAGNSGISETPGSIANSGSTENGESFGIPGSGSIKGFTGRM